MCVKIRQTMRANMQTPQRVNMLTFKLANLTKGDDEETK